jgi:hypothetical protein
MSAVKPHLEEQDDPSETADERAYFSHGTYADKIDAGRGAPGLHGLGDANPLTAHAWNSLQKSHSELVRMGFARQVTLDQLRERRYTVEARVNKKGVGTLTLVLDQPITGASWNAAGGQDIRRIDLLSWTSKMGCPSFSLPAGALEIGGACPGAVGGQSVVPEDALRAGQAHVTAVTQMPVSISNSICEKCYATGGDYIYGSNVLAQSVRLMWVRAALKDKTFVDTMAWAVEHADYLLDGGKVEKNTYDPERFEGRYFRIHDSGDFISRSYLAAWKQVADRFRDGPNKITFWAPTRVWATHWGIDAVNEINADAKHGSNLIIRPSIYHVNEQIPARNLGLGWANWSVVYHQRVKTGLFQVRHKDATRGAGAPTALTDVPAYDWDCQAYTTKSSHTCRNARGPQDTGAGMHGDDGCRACWVVPKASINYTEH